MNDFHTHRPEHEELVALYALGMLDGEELDALGEHLATGCEVCRRELAQRRGEVVLLAELVEPATPSPGAREAVLSRVAEASSPPEPVPDPGVARGSGPRPVPHVVPAGPRAEEAAAPVAAPQAGAAESVAGSGTRRAVGWGLALAAVLLIALLAWSLNVQRSLRGDVDRLAERNRSLQGQLDQRSAELDDLRTRLASTRAALRVVADEPVAVLAGLEAAPGARGRVYGEPGGGSVLVVVDALPPAPEGRIYQLWGIVGDKPVPAGIFDTNADGDGYLVADAPDQGPVEVWAITEEPAGGVPQPTGAMVLKS